MNAMECVYQILLVVIVDDSAVELGGIVGNMLSRLLANGLKLHIYAIHHKSYRSSQNDDIMLFDYHKSIDDLAGDLCATD